MRDEEVDIRAAVARFYDHNKHFPDDLAFYKVRIANPSYSVLELGCGTGRVLVPLSACCRRMAGVDHSPAMLAVCVERLAQESADRQKSVSLHAGDITRIDLQEQFDLITAPYRVFQNLDTSEQIRDFFEVVAKHLAPSGTCILNVFRLDEPFGELCSYWQERQEVVRWTVSYAEGTLCAIERVARWDMKRKVIYPDLVYRYVANDGSVQEMTASIAMRCYYPDEFRDLIAEHKFRIVGSWGGYAGEPYGKGAELIVQFSPA